MNASDNVPHEDYQEALLKIVIDFVSRDSEENIDDTIVKLKAVKQVLDPNSDLEGYTSPFDKLIDLAKDTKEAIENLRKTDADDSDDFYDDDDLPDHYYGDDGEVLFYDDQF